MNILRSPIIDVHDFSDLTKWYFNLNCNRNSAMDPRKLLPILALLVTIALPTEDLANDFVPSWHLLKHNVFFTGVQFMLPIHCPGRSVLWSWQSEQRIMGCWVCWKGFWRTLLAFLCHILCMFALQYVGWQHPAPQVANICIYYSWSAMASDCADESLVSYVAPIFKCYWARWSTARTTTSYAQWVSLQWWLLCLGH